jgi:endonuclease/exonuclease/phosphatase family metal-dependent hydrolase
MNRRKAEVPGKQLFYSDREKASLAFWLENLQRYQTLKELRHSDFYADCGMQIEQFLATPQIVVSPRAVPRLSSFLRVAQWNIEKGKQFHAILQLLENSDALKWADVLILNEADRGMNRSRNRHIALEIADRLGMHMAFGPAHFELTKGTEEELWRDGENAESLQGNAVLSRYPILEAQIVPLPVSFEPYEFKEKRYGRRSCLWARLRLKKGNLRIGSVHLELRNTPRCRATQIIHIVKRLPGKEVDSYLLGGDLNSNSFRRGTLWRTLQSVLRLLSCAPSKVKTELLHPELGREPLFKAFRDSGFDWSGLNSSGETARAAIHSLEEIEFFPASILNAVRKRLDPYQGYLCFKLDWLLGKNIHALSGGQKQDKDTGIVSLDPGCLKIENSGPDRISDHLPIYADIDLE